jgi:hypothetical protein
VQVPVLAGAVGLELVAVEEGNPSVVQPELLKSGEPKPTPTGKTGSIQVSEVRPCGVFPAVIGVRVKLLGADEFSPGID